MVPGVVEASSAAEATRFKGHCKGVSILGLVFCAPITGVIRRPQLFLCAMACVQWTTCRDPSFHWIIVEVVWYNSFLGFTS